MYSRLTRIAYQLDQINQYELADRVHSLMKIAQNTPRYNPYDKIQTLEATLNQLVEKSKKSEQRQDGTIAKLMQQIKNLETQIGNINGSSQEQISELESQQELMSAQQTTDAAAANNKGGLEGLQTTPNSGDSAPESADISL